MSERGRDWSIVVVGVEERDVIFRLALQDAALAQQRNETAASSPFRHFMSFSEALESGSDRALARRKKTTADGLVDERQRVA
jgi:hypothetical protein